MVSRSTCRLFDCDFKDPTSNYDLERAVEEGYLVPYQVVKHTTKFLRDGIKGHALTPEQVAEQILETLPSIIKERTAPPLGQLQVTNDAGEVGTSIN